MTPKEKAKELYQKMLPKDNSTHPKIFGRAKQCALIAVDEILKIGDEQYYNWKFWEEVKNEIEKL